MSERGCKAAIYRMGGAGRALLNTGLTVRKGEAGSHKKFGWHAVTDHIIGALGASSCRASLSCGERMRRPSGP